MGIQDIPTNASLTFVHAKNINPASIKESYCIPSIQINQVGTIPFNAADSILEENNLYKVMFSMFSTTHHNINYGFDLQTSYNQIAHIKLKYNENALTAADSLNVAVNYQPI